MKEIGGYIELDNYNLPMLHEGAIELNCGRNCLAYLFKTRGIKKLKIPMLICSSIISVCEREGVEKNFYHVGIDFKPTQDLTLEEDEWLYIVNFYGQLTNQEIKRYVEKFSRVIIDQANGYFETPILGVDTLYTCRKWFGVADGAFLYTDSILAEEIPKDESFDRMRFLLGRFERTASEFYGEYNENNKYFMNEPIKQMSKLTRNLLHGIDYSFVEHRRRENFEHLHKMFKNINQLTLVSGTFMYPLLLENGGTVRKKLQLEKIYIPTLWPTVFEVASPDDLEYQMAMNILPLPIDQRYDLEDMDYMIKKIKEIGGYNNV